MKVSRLPWSEWANFDARHPSPSFFSRPAWARALIDSGYALLDHVVRCDVSNGPSLIIPFMQASGKGKAWRRLFGMPLATYTVPMTSDGMRPNSETVKLALDWIMRRYCDSITFVLWP